MSLAYYYKLLGEKQHQLQRLQTCNSQLQECQQEFIYYERTITKPELSRDTWQGMLAAKFDTIRMEGILTRYRDMENQQFSAAFTVLSDKMQIIQNEISAIKQIITTLEAELAAERTKSK